MNQRLLIGLLCGAAAVAAQAAVCGDMVAGLPPYTVPLAAQDCTATLNPSNVGLLAGAGGLNPGSVVCFAPGDYPAQLAIYGKQGSASQPIYFRPQDRLSRPRFLKGLLVRDSGHLHLSGLEVHGEAPALVQAQAAVLVDTCRADIPFPNCVDANGTPVHTDVRSHHITLDSLTAEGAHFGVVVAQAGDAITVSNSYLRGNTFSGLQFVQSGAAFSAGRSVVTGNVVDHNDGHGIDIEDSAFVRIERNQVSCSGRALAAKAQPPAISCGTGACPVGGYSGIHLYTTSPDNPATRRTHHGLIRYNEVQASRDRDTGGSTADGNGIQVDHFSDDNEVSHNLLWDNDGAGISVLSAARNRVRFNTLRHNQQDPTRLSPARWGLASVDEVVRRWPLAELVLTACGPSGEFGPCAGGRDGEAAATLNEVVDNLIVAQRCGLPAVAVARPLAAYAGTAVISVGSNLLFSDCGGVSQTRLAWQVGRNFDPAEFITGVLLADAAVMDATTHAPAVTAPSSGTLIEKPVFTAPDAPASDGLQLKRRPSARGLIVASPPKDMAGKAPAAQASHFGAYYR